MDPLRHASPDDNDPGHTVTWLRVDLGNADMVPDPGVPCTATSVSLGCRERVAWARLGTWECPSSSAVAPAPWAASSSGCIAFWGKTDPGPQQSILGIKHLFCETYENLLSLFNNNQGSDVCALRGLREAGGVSS